MSATKVDHTRFELSRKERSQLRTWQRQTALASSESLGYVDAEFRPFVGEPRDFIGRWTDAELVEQLDGATMSVCGQKRALLYEKRRYADGTVLLCPAIAVLGIHDSPVHYHEITLERYRVNRGEGDMVFGDQVRKLRAGDALDIPTGVQHGFVSTTGEPAVITIEFLPIGLAPAPSPEERNKSSARNRDEIITCLWASVRANNIRFPNLQRKQPHCRRLAS